MLYRLALKEPRIIQAVRPIARISVLTGLAIALAATRAEAQISYGFGSFTFAGGSGCGMIGWGPPAPSTPSIGGYYPGSFVLVGGQLYYDSTSPYSSLGCSTGTQPTDGTGSNPDSFVESGVAGGDGGGGGGGETNGGDPTGDAPYTPISLDAPINGLTVTPEPSTVVLLGSGLLGLGVAVRRRRAKSQRPQDG